jgi:MATE family multidrug resistance protein
MDNVSYLAGAAIGSMIITQLYWVCGFMKMSITGLSAQAKGQNAEASLKVLVQGCFVALLLAILLLIINHFVLQLGLYFSQAQADVSQSIVAYFSARIWGAPAALINMVMIGWLIGQQKTKTVLLLQVMINLVNIVASLLFVFGLGWGVKGVAAATVLAEYLMLLFAIFMVVKWVAGQSSLVDNEQLEESGQSRISDLSLKQMQSWLSLHLLKPMLHLNSHILVRNLALQFTLAFITLRGAQYGAQAAAVNAIILQFFTLIALGLDGVANAVEALVGEAKGKRDIPKINQQVRIGLIWSSIFAMFYSFAFYYLDSPIVKLLTHHQSVIDAMTDYTLVIILLPIVAHWCFLFDGVFVGLSKGKPMRNSMLVSTLLVFLPVWWVFSDGQNMALWFAMLAFLASRGFLLGVYYWAMATKWKAKLLQ